MRRLAIVLTLVMLIAPLLPVPVLAAEDALSYPVLSDKVQHYQTTFPSGLKYLKGWYGTFEYAPPVRGLLDMGKEILANSERG